MNERDSKPLRSMVFDQALFMRSLPEFSYDPASPHETEQALTRKARLLTQLLGLEGCGVSLGRDHASLQFATAVPDHLADLETVQLTTGVGPCITAYDERRVVAVEDLREHTPTWPDFCATAHRVGLTSVASIPMLLNDVSVGTFDLYADGQRAWPADDLAIGTAVAEMATRLLMDTSVIHRQAEANAQLRAALDSRIVIEQAKGMLASAHGISADAAFERIRDHARAERVKVQDVATALVNRDLTL